MREKKRTKTTMRSKQIEEAKKDSIYAMTNLSQAMSFHVRVVSIKLAT